jgi:O-acetyl-ADP-ribose deacetylase (regulator of RNase III)
MPRFALGNSELRFVQGDITELDVDAIVNAANQSLAGGGGVDGAIHHAGGPQLMKELNEIRAKIGRCPAGDAVVTSGGELRARYVFHAVGPIFRDGKHGEPEQLASCYRTCLQLAVTHSVATIAFPSISTGAYGYPIEEAAAIALRTIRDWTSEHPNQLKQISLVQFSGRDHKIYVRSAEQILGEGRLE